MGFICCSPYSRRNPVLSAGACALVAALLACGVYTIGAAFSFAQFERFAPASGGCVVVSFFVSSVACVPVAPQPCYSCTYSCAFSALDGTPLIGFTSRDPPGGGLPTDAAARAYCAARQAASNAGAPLPAWYEPALGSGQSAYLSLEAPSAPASLAPVVVLAVLFAFICAGVCACTLRAAPPDPALQAAYELARQRARDLNMQAVMWSASLDRDRDHDRGF